MWSLILGFAKTKLISIASKVNIKDIMKSADKAIDKVSEPVKQVNKIRKELAVDLKVERKVKEPAWQTYFPFTFFYGGGKFQPIYFFVTVFCFLASAMLFVKIYAAWSAIKKGTYTSDMISTADLATVLTFVSSLVLLYNNNKKNASKEVVTDSNNQV